MYDKDVDPSRIERPAIQTSGLGQIRREPLTATSAVLRSNTRVGPTLVTDLTDSVRGLRELRFQLAAVSQRLRGSIPESGSDKEKEPELTLHHLSETFRSLLEQCHAEVAEISALLS